MFVVGARSSCSVCKPDVKEVPESSVFKAGIVSAIALFGLAWLTDTFIVEWETEIVDTVGGWVNDYQSVFFFGVFLVAALTTSQSTATRTIVPIGLAVGLCRRRSSAACGPAASPASSPCRPTARRSPPPTSTRPAPPSSAPSCIDHSFIIPVLLLSVTTVARGRADRRVFF